MARLKVSEKHEDGSETQLVPEADPAKVAADADEVLAEIASSPEAPPETPPQGAPASPESRPSLEVAIETHRNLQKRVEALCLRVASWSVVAKVATATGDVRGSAIVALDAFRAMGNLLEEAKRSGYIAKTTDRSRKEARLALGGPVKLSDATKKVYAYTYSPEELDEVTVVSRTEDHVWVKLGHRENVLPIPLKLSQLVLG